MRVGKENSTKKDFDVFWNETCEYSTKEYSEAM